MKWRVMVQVSDAGDPVQVHDGGTGRNATSENFTEALGLSMY